MLLFRSFNCYYAPFFSFSALDFSFFFSNHTLRRGKKQVGRNWKQAIYCFKHDVFAPPFFVFDHPVEFWLQINRSGLTRNPLQWLTHFIRITEWLYRLPSQLCRLPLHPLQVKMQVRLPSLNRPLSTRSIWKWSSNLWARCLVHSWHKRLCNCRTYRIL